MRERLEVEAAATDDDCVFSAGMNLCDRLRRRTSKFFRVHLLQDRHRPDQMMRHFRERWPVGFGGQNLKTFVNLKRVGIDDLCLDLMRNISRDFGFPDRRWTDNEKNTFHLLASRATRRGVPIINKNRETRFRSSPGLDSTSNWLLARLALARLRTTHDELAAEEFLVVQLLNGALRFLDSLHVHESKTFRALVVPITHDLGVLHVADTVEQFEEIAFRRVEGKVADVKTRRSDFDWIRFALWP